MLLLYNPTYEQPNKHRPQTKDNRLTGCDALFYRMKKADKLSALKCLFVL